MKSKLITLTTAALIAIILQLPPPVLAQNTTTPKADQSKAQARLDHTSRTTMLPLLLQLKKQLQVTREQLHKELHSLKTEQAETLTFGQLETIEMELYRQLAKLRSLQRKFLIAWLLSFVLVSVLV